ncbi:MAG TPA: hypothetical protein VIT22_12990 [Pseudoxanthomonas sp.]
MLLVAVLGHAALLLQGAGALVCQALAILALAVVAFGALAFFADAALLLFAAEALSLLAAFVVAEMVVADILVATGYACRLVAMLLLFADQALLLLAAVLFDATGLLVSARDALPLLTLGLFALGIQTGLRGALFIVLALPRLLLGGTLALDLLALSLLSLGIQAFRLLLAGDALVIGAVLLGLALRGLLPFRLLPACGVLTVGLFPLGVLTGLCLLLCSLLTGLGLLAAWAIGTGVVPVLFFFFLLLLGAFARVVLGAGGDGEAHRQSGGERDRPQGLLVGGEFHVGTFVRPANAVLACA